MNYKDAVKKIPVVGGLTRWAYLRLKGTYLRDPSYWIAKILKDQEAVVVQIGSNDGVTGDPIHDLLLRKQGWKALFVEPVPYLFDRLKRNYSGNPRFKFENSVVNDGSNITFYWVAEQAKESIPSLPDWHDQLGGFDRAHITRHIPELEDHIEEAKLSGITLDHLFAKHDIAKIDLLHIDTEGADFKILSQLDLKKQTPKIILYERKHLSKEEEDASILFLKERYVLYNFGADILAVERVANKAMPSTLDPLRKFRVTDL